MSWWQKQGILKNSTWLKRQFLELDAFENLVKVFWFERLSNCAILFSVCLLCSSYHLNCCHHWDTDIMIKSLSFFLQNTLYGCEPLNIVLRTTKTWDMNKKIKSIIFDIFYKFLIKSRAFMWIYGFGKDRNIFWWCVGYYNIEQE